MNFFPAVEDTSPYDSFILCFQQKFIVKQGRYLWQKEEIEFFLSGDISLVVVDGAVGDKPAQILVRLSSDISHFLEAELKSLRSILFSGRPGLPGSADGISSAIATVGKANQLAEWYDSHRYCGNCGRENRHQLGHRALHCEPCNKQYFPRINPCVIMLVTRGDEILLARNGQANSKFFSCLAGFMEPGETPEQCVAREVMEEVGIKVKNIRYHKSQSWPFPSQLMLGFYAEYESGEIQPDGEEIAEAGWYRVGEFPVVPSGNISVAGQLIEDWVAR